MQFDAKLTHSLCHVFYATTLQISRLRQEIADLKSKLESTEDNFNNSLYHFHNSLGNSFVNGPGVNQFDGLPSVLG